MRRLKTMVAATALMLATAATTAFGGAFQSKDVPADAKWVVHVDIDALRATKAWKTINERLQDNIDAQLKFQALEDAIGVRFPDDFHDVTLYGDGFGEKPPVVLIHLDIDRERVRNMLSNAQNFSTTTHNKHEVLSWLDQDKNKQMYGTFISDSFIAIGNSADMIDQALDAIDGKIDTLAKSTLLAGPQHAGVLLYAGSAALQALQKAKPNPVFSQMQGGWLAVSERGDALVLHAEVQAANSQAAQKMIQSVLGIKAMLALASSSEKPNPDVVMIANALGSLDVSASDDMVKAEWPVKEATVQTFIDEQIAKKQHEHETGKEKSVERSGGAKDAAKGDKSE